MVWDLIQSFSTVGADFLYILPSLVSVAVILLVGLVVGKIAGRIVKEVLEKSKLDYYVTEEKRPAVSLSSVFSLAARWWVYFVFVGQAVAVSNLRVLEDSFRLIANFIPSVIGAAAILVSGYVLGEYLRSHIRKANRVYAEVVGKVLLFFILYVAIALSLAVLGVPSRIVDIVLIVIVGSIGIGVAIALGFGLKDVVADIGKRYVKKLKI